MNENVTITIEGSRDYVALATAHLTVNCFLLDFAMRKVRGADMYRAKLTIRPDWNFSDFDPDEFLDGIAADFAE